MERPDWVPAPAWARLDAALHGQLEHALDALADLEAVSASMDARARSGLVESFTRHAESGVRLPAAFILALNDLLETGHE